MLKKICKDCKTVYDFNVSECKCGGELQIYLVPDYGLNKVLSKVKSIFSSNSLEKSIMMEFSKLNQWETLFKQRVMFDEAKKDNDFSYIDLDAFFNELNDFKKANFDFELLDNLVVENKDYKFLLEGYNFTCQLIAEFDSYIDKIKSFKLEDISLDTFLEDLRKSDSGNGEFVGKLRSEVLSYDNLEYLNFYDKDLKLNIDNLKEVNKLYGKIDDEIGLVKELSKDFARFDSYFKDEEDKPSNYDSFKKQINGLKYLDVMEYFDNKIESDANQVKEFITTFDEFENELERYNELKSDLDSLYDEFDKLSGEDVDDSLKEEFLNRYSGLIEDINSFSYLARRDDISDAHDFFNDFDGHWDDLAAKHEELERILSYNDSYSSFYNSWNDFLAGKRDHKDIKKFLKNFTDLKKAVFSFKFYDSQKKEYLDAMDNANDIKFKLENIGDFVKVNNADFEISEFFDFCDNNYIRDFDKWNLEKKYDEFVAIEPLSKKIDFKVASFDRFIEVLDDFDNFIRKSNEKIASEEIKKYDKLKPSLDRFYNEFNRLRDENVNGWLKTKFLNKYSRMVKDIDSFIHLANEKDILRAKEFFNNFDLHWEDIVAKHEELERILSYNDSYNSFYNAWNDLLDSKRDNNDIIKFLNSFIDLKNAVFSFRFYDSQKKEYLDAMDAAKDIKFKLENIDDFVKVNNADFEISEFFSLCSARCIGDIERQNLKKKYDKIGNLWIVSKRLDFKYDNFKRLKSTLVNFDDFIKNSNEKNRLRELEKYNELKPYLDILYNEFNSLRDENVNDSLKNEFLNKYSKLVGGINSFTCIKRKKDISDAITFFNNFETHWQNIVAIHEEFERILSYNGDYKSFYDSWNNLLASKRDGEDIEKFLDDFNDLKEAILSFKFSESQKKEYLDAMDAAKDIKFKLENICDFVKVNNGNIKISEFFNLDDIKYVSTNDGKTLKEDCDKIGKLEGLSKKLKFKEDNFQWFNETLVWFDDYIDGSNKMFFSNELQKYKSFFDDIDGKSLDENQRSAVVIDEDNMQVVAGAGCGKTLTISGKIKYLFDKGVKADEILCLSYSKASATDLVNKLPKDIKASTFHALGKGIYEENLGEKIIVKENMLYDVVNDFFANGVLEDERLLEKVTDYFLYYSYDLIDKEDKNLGEILEIEEGRSFTTLKERYTQDDEKTTFKNKQKVRSFEELLIANYLFIHGINYEYEKQYTDSEGEKVKEWSNYKPDFYLTDYDIYLEHFGVNRDLDAPWLDKKNSDKYKQEIFDKRAFHKEHGTKLIETYSYFASENILMSKLDEILQENGVEIKEVDHKEILAALSKNDRIESFGFLTKLIRSFISLFKGNNYGLSKFNEFKELAEKEPIAFNRERHLLFLDIAEEIFRRYEKELANPDFVDFDDMINYATDIIAENKVFRNYRYIIVDEYQDISYSRFKLLKALQNASNAKIFVVGDDWQSIYRFTGCDVTLFTEFNKYFSHFKRCYIENTYRNSQSLIDIAGKFIKKNPKQLNKELNSKLSTDIKNPIKVAYYNDDDDNSKITALEQCILDISKNSGNILILGRYKFSIDPYIKTEGTPFKIKGNKIIYSKNPSLNIKFLTAHSSKGLEEDNVILLDLKNDYLGFPSKKEDDGVLKYVIDEGDQFEFAEERRLFYVAITRTKKYNYFLVDENSPSKFVEELKEYADFDVIQEIPHDYENEKFIRTKLKCPVCKTGNITILNINKNFRKFICSHKNCSFDGGVYRGDFKDLDILENCPRCGGVLVKRNGRKGPFLGCTSYPGCKYSRSIGEDNENEKKEISGGSVSSKSKDNSKSYKSHNSNDVWKCPDCGSDLVKRKGPRGEFIGCSAFPNCRYTRNIGESKKTPKEASSYNGESYENKKQNKSENSNAVGKCPDCGSDLVKRKGPRGEFIGCSAFPNCRYTRNIGESKKTPKEASSYNGESYGNKKQDKSENSNVVGKCPKCGGDLVIRNGDFGEFIGCTSYPDCMLMCSISKLEEVKKTLND